MYQSSNDKLLYKILVNDDFIHYVLEPTESLTQQWNRYFELHPNELPLLDVARNILTGKELTNQLSPFEIKELENEILQNCLVTGCN